MDVSAPPVDTAQTLEYANTLHHGKVSNGPSLPYNADTEAGGSVSSGPFAFAMPMIPIVVEHHEPSS
jgi:hypothetical protein